MATNADNINNVNQLFLEPNVLDSYQSYTYNFKLKLYNINLLETNRLPESTDKSITIAESGVTTAFNIRRVEMKTIPGTTRENKGTLTNLIKIELEEPLGFTFIDRLLQAGKQLGLPNLCYAPYVLELSFVGWDENGNAIKPILPIKTWILNLTKVLPELRKGGSHYSLEFVPKNEQVQQDIRCKVKKTIKFKKAASLVDTLNNFATAMSNASDIASEKTNYTVSGSQNDPVRLRHLYKFITQDGDTQTSKLSTWTMVSNLNQNTQRQNEVTPSAGSPTQFEVVVQPGKDIFEVITALIANTNEAYKFVCPAANTNQAEFDKSEFTNFFHFDTITTNEVYDPKTGSYTQTHIVTIVPKVVSRNSILTKDPGTSTDVKKLITDNLLVKGYEYIFTGKNTSVLDLNLNFSSMWTDSMPLFLSLLKNSHLSSNLAPNTMPIDNILPPVPSVNKSTVTQNSNQTTPFALTAKRPDLPSPTNYLSDYSTNAITIEQFSRQEPDRDYSQTEKYTKGYSTAGDQASITKLSIFGYLADNSLINLNPSKLGVSSMLSVNMIIRGDPYWLGITSEEVEAVYNGTNFVTLRKTQRQFAVFQSGEQNFYLKFRPPQNLDTNTGLMNFNNSSIFNTVYSVLEVTSIFENGVFKQELNSVINRSIQSEAAQITLNPLLTISDSETLKN